MRNKKGERIQKVIVCNGKRERERETGWEGERKKEITTLRMAKMTDFLDINHRPIFI
jgi:hypothetical protein